MRTEIAPPNPPLAPIDEYGVIARAIEVAAEDPELGDRVEAPRYQRFGPYAGAARNWVSMLSGEDPSSPAVERHLCTGIARQAAQVLEAARARGDLFGVRAVSELERRNVEGREEAHVAYHTAVQVELTTGRKVVLDWHATLDLHAPRISDPQAF